MRSVPGMVPSHLGVGGQDMRVADQENRQVSDRSSSRDGRTSTRYGNRTRTARKTKVQIRADIRETSRPKAKPKSHFLRDAAVQVLICGAVFGFTYAGRCLYGHVEVATARAAESVAKERADEARRAKAGLQFQVDRLKNPLTVDHWAKTHGYRLVARLEEPAED